MHRDDDRPASRALDPTHPGPTIGRRGLAGVFVVSLAVIVLQVALTRLFSVVMWYHFAFVAISLAMAGLAVGGIALYLWPALMRRADAVIPASCAFASLATAGALAYLVRVPVRSDSAADLLGTDVVALYLVSLLPFLFAGLAISAALARYARQIDRVYFYDLVGAGLGCAVVVALLNGLGAPAAVLGAAVLFGLGALLLARPAARGDVLLGAGAAAITSALLLWQVATPVLEPVYTRGKTDSEQAGTAILERWNSHSRIKVYDQPHDASRRAILIDGNACTFLFRLEESATPESVSKALPFVMKGVAATPYVILPERPEVLVIGPGGGRDLLVALGHGARVTGVELNGIVFDFMCEGPIADWSGGLYRAPGVTTIHDEARSWLSSASQRFDLVQVSVVDTWAATAAGAFALAENALYTVEAFEEYFDHLKPDGVVHFSRYYRDPPRDSLRTVVLMEDVMRRRGVAHPEEHLAVFLDPIDGDPVCASILWSKSPLRGERLAKLERYASSRFEGIPEGNLTPLHLPGRPPTEPIGRFVASADRARFVDEYPYDVSPTTDDRPFFFNSVRLGDVVSIRGETFANEQAVVVLVATLLTVLAIVLAAFVVPFVARYRAIRAESGRGTVARLLYFCAIGIGFMLIEIPAIQRFGLYVGHPTYALTTVLASFLVGTGVGSFGAGRWFGGSPVRGARLGLLLVVAGVVVLVSLVPPLLAATLAQPRALRIAVTVLLLAPLGFVMGFPLPLGVRALHARADGLVPWAWGMNGAASVLASVLGVVIGTYSGFTAAALTGAAAYGAAWALAGRLAPSVTGSRS